MSSMNMFVAPRIADSVQEQFDQLLDHYNGRNGIGIRRKLNDLIKQEPYCFNAYLLRHQILLDEDNIVAADKELKRVFEVAEKLIISESGEWPPCIPWEIGENRPLLRALYGGAMYCWWRKEPAVLILRKLLKVCPNDNVGARFALLGVQLEVSYKDWLELQEDEMVLLQWFEENAGKFSQEFQRYL
jgi:hypothetical protein